VIVRWDGHGVANDGMTYDNSYAWFMTLRDGLVIDGTALRQHRVRRALATLRRGGDVRRRQESRKPGASAPA